MSFGTSPAIYYGIGTGGAIFTWTPLALFQAGGVGGYYDFSRADTLFSNSGFTVPATVGGQIQGVLDLSGGAHHLTTALTNIIRQANYATFAGSTFPLQCGSFAASAAAGNTKGCAFRPNSGAVTQGLIAVDRDSACNQPTGAMYIDSTGVAVVADFFGSSCAQKAVGSGPASIVGGNDYAAIGRYQPSLQSTIIVNNVESVVAYAAVSPTATSATIGLGAQYYGTTALQYVPYSGRMYAAVFINRPITDVERTNLNIWLRLKAGLSV